MSADCPRVEISSAVELREWLVANHQVSQGIGLVTFSAIDATGDSRVDRIGQTARDSPEADCGDRAAGGAERPGQPVAACLASFRGTKNGPGIEDAERVQRILDGQ